MFCTVKENSSICFSGEEGFRLFTGLEDLWTYCWATRNCLIFNFLVCTCESFFFFTQKNKLKFPVLTETLRPFSPNPWPLTFTCWHQVFMSSSKALWTKKWLYTIPLNAAFSFWVLVTSRLLSPLTKLSSCTNIPLDFFFFFGPSPFYLFSPHTVFVFIHQLVNTSFNGGEAAFLFCFFTHVPLFQVTIWLFKNVFEQRGPRSGRDGAFLSVGSACALTFRFFFFSLILSHWSITSLVSFSLLRCLFACL